MTSRALTILDEYLNSPFAELRGNAVRALPLVPGSESLSRLVDASLSWFVAFALVFLLDSEGHVSYSIPPVILAISVRLGSFFGNPCLSGHRFGRIGGVAMAAASGLLAIAGLFIAQAKTSEVYSDAGTLFGDPLVLPYACFCFAAAGAFKVIDDEVNSTIFGPRASTAVAALVLITLTSLMVAAVTPLRLKPHYEASPLSLEAEGRSQTIRILPHVQPLRISGSGTYMVGLEPASSLIRIAVCPGPLDLSLLECKDVLLTSDIISRWKWGLQDFRLRWKARLDANQQYFLVVSSHELAFSHPKLSIGSLGPFLHAKRQAWIHRGSAGIRLAKPLTIAFRRVPE